MRGAAAGFYGRYSRLMPAELDSEERTIHARQGPGYEPHAACELIATSLHPRRPCRNRAEGARLR